MLSAEGSKGAPDPDPGEVAAMDELEPGRVPPAPHGLATAPPPWALFVESSGRCGQGGTQRAADDGHAGMSSLAETRTTPVHLSTTMRQRERESLGPERGF